MDRKLAYFWLSHLTFFTVKELRLLLDLFNGDPLELFLHGHEALMDLGVAFSFTQMEQYESLRDESVLQSLYEKLEPAGVNYVCMEDDAYPARLDVLEDRPFGLFYRGALPDRDTLSAAVVGSRTCTSYGREMAHFFGSSLTSAGVNVISGMALGIDGYAQRGAVSSESVPGSGRSFAVLAGGCDICYPRENIGLYADLKENGHGILSEKPPGTRSLPRDFPVRNRIIAALCDVLAVIEAAENSGSLITVNCALAQGKEVFALPGRVGDRMAFGCNELIKNGAQVLTSPEDILQYLGVRVGKETRHYHRTALSKEEKVIFDLMGTEPVSVDELLLKSAFTVGTLQQILLQLEIKGIIRKEPLGGYIALKK